MLCWSVCIAGWFALLAGLLYWLVCFAGWFALLAGLLCWLVCLCGLFALLVGLCCGWERRWGWAGGVCEDGLAFENENPPTEWWWEQQRFAAAHATKFGFANSPGSARSLDPVTDGFAGAGCLPRAVRHPSLFLTRRNQKIVFPNQSASTSLKVRTIRPARSSTSKAYKQLRLRAPYRIGALVRYDCRTI